MVTLIVKQIEHARVSTNNCRNAQWRISLFKSQIINESNNKVCTKPRIARKKRGREHYVIALFIYTFRLYADFDNCQNCLYTKWHFAIDTNRTKATINRSAFIHIWKRQKFIRNISIFLLHEKTSKTINVVRVYFKKSSMSPRIDIARFCV